MARWLQIGQRLIGAVKRNWGESELDSYILPHPILGKLTIREMLFFTLYHDTLHLSAGAEEA
jgi:hypothetical protein